VPELPAEAALTPGPKVAAQCDVLVIGAGPAGCAAAISLARLGCHVRVLERGRHPRFHIGESLLPMSMPLLEELGVLEAVEQLGVIKRGADFPTGAPGGYQVFRFDRCLHPTWTHAVQVPRAGFDSLLCSAARSAGAEVIEGIEATAVRFAGAKAGAGEGGEAAPVVVEALDAAGLAQRHAARYLLDCSGRDTLLGNQLRLKRRNRRHQSAALYAHYEGVTRRDGEDAGNISIYRLADGWAWLIPLPEGRTSLGIVCGPATLRERRDDAEAFLRRQCASVPGLAERMAGARLAGNLQATGNYSYDCRRYAGPAWVTAGDASAFLDPIFSSGVHMALVTGIDAAQLAYEVLTQPGREAQLQREYEARHRAALRRVSWFILRFNAPVMRQLWANPRNDWQLEQAIISMLAGDLHRDGGIHWRLRLFKLIYYIACLGRLPDALAGRWQRWRRSREQFAGDPASPGPA
jgi:flavin-dependent dehydrogenase